MILKRPSSDSPPSFVVYVFREFARAPHPGRRKRVHWLRAAVCPDLHSALLRAELIRGEPNVRRVQVFEQVTDRQGNARAARIVRSLRPSPFREFFASL